jgi:filamentous hemagglutinin family protein
MWASQLVKWRLVVVSGIAGVAVNSRDYAAIDRHVKPESSPFSLKSLRTPLLATTAICAVIIVAHPASAQSPTGGAVVAGAAGIAQAGAVTTINQSSQKAIINWQGFSVGAQNTVNFNQPNSSAATLNRVIGNERSVIDGAINANGQVFIVNSNGVLFGKGAQVNVGGLVASTLDISNNASVVNQGRIRARGGGQGGGYVALLGKTVSNEGVIAAKLGTVAMASGEQITLNFGGDSLLDVTIDKGTLNALVQNKRAIIANGGQVIMTAKAADQVLSAQVNNSGIIQARTMAALKGGNSGGSSNGGKVRIGKIKLLAQGGTTNVSGKLDASAPKGGDGGFIETSGDHVNIADSAIVTTAAPYGSTGTWLIDPNDFTVAASGGNMTGAAVAAALLSNNFEIKTATMGTPGGNGDIFVNDAIAWSTNNTLTLTAERDVNINQAITASGASAGLALNAGNNININNAIKLDGANATLAMTYGGSYNIRTPASYSGAVTGPVYDRDGKPVYELVSVQKVNPPLDNTNGSKATYGGPTPGPVYDADGNPVYEQVQGNQVTGLVGQQDTSGGVYGSITFSNSANTFGTNPNGLTINGQVTTWSTA